MSKNEVTKTKFRIGEILVNHGYISEEELQKALAAQKESTTYAPLGQVCVNSGYISGVELTSILRKYQKHIYLGELLVNMGLINDEQLEQVLQKQKQEKKRIGELLIESGYLTEEQLVSSLSMQLGIPKIAPDLHLIDQKLALRFSEAFLRRQEAVPAYEKEGVVTIIMTDPLSDQSINDFKKYFNAEIEAAIATRSAINHLLDILFNKIEYGLKKIDELEGKDLIIGNDDYAKDSRDDTVNIVNYIISSAIAEGASDIHIEPQSYNLRVRYRIDGVLQHKTDLPKQLTLSIISRIKVMCGMNIAEHRRHQDGRIQARVLDNDIDLRVSAYSAIYGENIVIRILRRRTTLIDIKQLGFSPLHQKRFQNILDAPTGIILVCGPTGSGKTTTLYASLTYLNKMDKKIITVEDPVEYTMDGVVQGQLNPKMGVSYSDFIASMMRQDPDVIMVGEIRDNVAAGATIQAALTGHKAFSTFHTEDSTGALLRLMDMGIETFLISSTVVSVVAQRLVRKVCERCSEPYQPDPAIFHSFGIKNVDIPKYNFRRGHGCDFCHGTGYKGRTGIHEILIVNDDIRDAILTRKMSTEIRRIAKTSANMVTMREDGFYKASQGITNLDEILRVIFYSDAESLLPREAEEVIKHLNGEEIVSPMDGKRDNSSPPAVNISLPSAPPSVVAPETEGRAVVSGQVQSEGGSCPINISYPGPQTLPEITPILPETQGLKSSPSQISWPHPIPASNSISITDTEQNMIKNQNMITEQNIIIEQNMIKNQEVKPKQGVEKKWGEVYRIRFEADTIILEQDRIGEFFKKYRSLETDLGNEIREDLVSDFIDFIIYHTKSSQRKGAMFVEFFIKPIGGQAKIFMQFQSHRQIDNLSYLKKHRGQRLLEFLA